MTHPLVDQLRFTRKEFLRGLKGLSDEDAAKRVGPANCIAWNVGHLAWQEQRYWLIRGQGLTPFPDVNKEFAYGAPGTTPQLTRIRRKWRAITTQSDPFLETLTSKKLAAPILVKGKPSEFTYGSLLLRMIYHYWYHNGENIGIRQALGHAGLAEFVGDIDRQAPYRPER